MSPAKQNQATGGVFAILNALHAHAQAGRIIPAGMRCLSSQKLAFAMIDLKWLLLHRIFALTEIFCF
jgi:hypothetical protein